MSLKKTIRCSLIKIAFFFLKRFNRGNLNFNGLIVPKIEERRIDRKGERQPFRVQNFYFEKILPRPGIEPATPGSRGKCLYHLTTILFHYMKDNKDKSIP
uniref:Uncharacterized protein n=1 Tax=Cacopsylla melanoneura TaxID=428564 RepID=A0A8D9AF13_9HEMI